MPRQQSQNPQKHSNGLPSSANHGQNPSPSFVMALRLVGECPGLLGSAPGIGGSISCHVPREPCCSCATGGTGAGPEGAAQHGRGCMEWHAATQPNLHAEQVLAGVALEQRPLGRVPLQQVGRQRHLAARDIRTQHLAYAPATAQQTAQKPFRFRLLAFEVMAFLATPAPHSSTSHASQHAHHAHSLPVPRTSAMLGSHTS